MLLQKKGVNKIELGIKRDPMGSLPCSSMDYLGRVNTGRYGILKQMRVGTLTLTNVKCQNFLGLPVEAGTLGIHNVWCTK